MVADKRAKHKAEKFCGESVIGDYGELYYLLVHENCLKTLCICCCISSYFVSALCLLFHLESN